MDNVALVKLVRDTEFWRRTYGEGYLFVGEIANIPRDNPTQALPETVVLAADKAKTNLRKENDMEQLTLEEMNSNNEAAEKELLERCAVEELSIFDVAAWWKKWYLKCGHKRLGRVLLKFLPEEV